MWEKVKLGDVIEKTETVNPTSKFPSDSFEYIDVSSVSKERLAIEETQTLLGKDAPSRARRKIQRDDIIFATVRPTLKRVAVVPMELDGQICSTGYIVLRVKKDVLLPRYLFHWMTSKFVMDYVESIQTGASYPAVTDKQVKDIDIQFPPLVEQQRIVAKLDAAFAKIDEAVEAVKKNIQNSKHYYSYAIDNEFSKYSDKTKSIGEHSKINYGHTAKASFEKGRYKFLRITDIQDNAVDWNSVPYCEVETKKLPSVLLNDGDIVFARTGATTGKSFLVENPVDSVFASYLIRVSIDKKVFLPKYVMHYFQSAAYWQQVNEGISGAAQGGFNATKLGKLRIPVINKTEQLKMVQKLDLINEQSASLQNTYALKMHALNSLKSAILSQELNSSEAA